MLPDSGPLMQTIVGVDPFHFWAAMAVMVVIVGFVLWRGESKPADVDEDQRLDTRGPDDR